jgi:hypothetical protein
MKQILTILLLAIQLAALSQASNKVTKIKFQSLNQIGYVDGEGPAELIVQSINGLRIHSFFIGAGVGLDYYKERSVPIFLDVRKNILNNAKSPFIYVDGGYHAMWSKENPEVWNSEGYKGGRYFDAGVGYSFPAFKNTAFTVSLGYSQKEMSEKRPRYSWFSSTIQPNDFEKLEYKLKRYSFKMGLAF